MRFLALLLALSLTPVLAQDAARQASLAERYGVPGWPASAPSRVGLDPASIQAEGWQVLEVQRDARRAEARVGFARQGVAVQVALASLRLRRHPGAAEARRALLGALGAVQATLAPRKDLGDLAYGTRGYVVGTYSNLEFCLRAAKPGVDLEQALLPALAAALRATAPLEAGAPLALPAAEVEVGQPARPTPFRLAFAPEAPEAAAIAFACSGDASVLRTAEGYTLYPAPGPSEVEVRVFLCTADLRQRIQRFTVVFPQ